LLDLITGIKNYEGAMLLNLTDFSKEPLHDQISRQMLEKILAGDLTDGMKIESVRSLARAQHINIHTVKRAYEELENAGVIKSKSGAGFFVNRISDEQKREIVKHRLLGYNSPLNVIDTFSKELSSVFDPEKLQKILEENIKKYLFAKNVHFALFNEKIDKFVLSPLQEPDHEIVFGAEDEFFQAICRLILPSSLKDVQHEGEESSLQSELKRRNIQIVFPLKDSKRYLGFIALSEKTSGKPFLQDDLGVLSVLVNQFATALLTARFYVEAVEKRRIEEELNTARQIQQDLLPESLPDNDNFQIAAYSEPSQTVGGDFYDYIPIDENRFGLVIADACGKGMPAALVISQIQAILKSEINNGNSLKETIESLNKHLKRYTSAKNFTTLFYGIIDINSKTFEYVNAGHNYPFLIRKRNGIEYLKTTGPALGIFPGSSIGSERIKLKTGDTILFYTDGITETMNSRGEEFGERRLKDILFRNKDAQAQDNIHAIIRELNEFNSSDLLHDDRTIMLVKIK